MRETSETATYSQTKRRFCDQQCQQKLIALRRALIVQKIIHGFDEPRRLKQKPFTQHSLSNRKEDQSRLFAETVKCRDCHFAAFLRIRCCMQRTQYPGHGSSPPC